jgi:hypothetical protein
MHNAGKFGKHKSECRYEGLNCMRGVIVHFMNWLHVISGHYHRKCIYLFIAPFVFLIIAANVEDYYYYYYSEC